MLPAPYLSCGPLQMAPLALTLLLLCSAGCSAQPSSVFEVPNAGSVLLSGNVVAVTFSDALNLSPLPSAAQCCPGIDIYRNGARLRALATAAVTQCSAEWVGQANAATGKCGQRFLWTVPLDLAPGGGYALVLAASGQASPAFAIAAPALAVQAPRYANGMLDPLQCGRGYHYHGSPPPPPPPAAPPPPHAAAAVAAAHPNPRL